ncbi:DUF3265 domain-containing protein [Vibrio parahaemolyticus]|nr:DUF3265 domain-containing protein [Vibrio parahaemolyticus]TOF32566.1 DUF3265 domain-containing protein [Vibrio parahaemolyticus]
MVVCIERAGKIHITRRSRGIHAAWHFWYAVSFGGESDLRKVGLSGTHPLTQRYIFVRNHSSEISYLYSKL